MPTIYTNVIYNLEFGGKGRGVWGEEKEEKGEGKGRGGEG